MHEKDRNSVLAIGEKKNHFVSSDAGATWRKIVSKNKIRHMFFHPTRPKWLLVTSFTEDCKKEKREKYDVCAHMAWITKDLGYSFQLIDTYVVQVSWGSQAHGQEDWVGVRFRGRQSFEGGQEDWVGLLHHPLLS